jgi:beta-lactamase class A
MSDDVVGDVLAIADRMGVDVAVSARRADDTGISVRHRGEDLWPGASLYKVLAGIAVARLGPELWDERILVRPEDHVPGGAGLSLLADPVELSFRDLVTSMLTGSDNTAADVILRRTGLSALNEVVERTGMNATRIAPTSTTVQEAVAARARQDPAAEGPTDRDTQLVRFAAEDRVLGSLTTADDQVRMLCGLWQGRLVPVAGRDLLLSAMSRQVMKHRIASAFDHPGVSVAGKTGTWGPFRHESALVMHDDEVPIAVSVLTESSDFERLLPDVDDGMGR